MLLEDFSSVSVNGDNRIANLIGPGIHHLGNIGVTAILIYGLQTWHKSVNILLNKYHNLIKDYSDNYISIVTIITTDKTCLKSKNLGIYLLYMFPEVILVSVSIPKVRQVRLKHKNRVGEREGL